MSFSQHWGRQLSLYFRSVQYLHPVQILARLALLWRRRVLYRFKPWLYRYTHATGQEPYSPLPIPVQGTDVRCDLYDAESHTFNFLNRWLDLGQPVDWFSPQASQLWLYNLHYFEYAVALGQRYAQQDGDAQSYWVFRGLAEAWIAACPVATPLAWDPYPTSLRLANWLKAYTLFGPALDKDPDFAQALRRSLYTQARFLEDNLEYHLLGNHLIENGRALLWAGLFFTDRTAARWRRKGERILWRALREQFLDDGGHAERSPMYHRIMLALYAETLMLLEARNYPIPDEDKIKHQVDTLCAWARQMAHPDGDIPLFNDAALGIAPPRLNEGDSLGNDGLTALPDSGYFIFRDWAAGHCLIWDCGPLGPDHQPGHGHCDALSYELSIGGQRFIVDSGVETYYGELDWRAYYRSTRAHNTLVVDGAEQSEIWNRFRAARRAYPVDVVWDERGPELAYAIGAHSGYRRLSGRVMHRRWVCWIERRCWLICDHVTGAGTHQVESLIHWHSQVEIVRAPTPSQAGQVRCGGMDLQVLPFAVNAVSCYRGEIAPIQGWYAPEFGLRIPNHVWGFQREGELPLWLGYVLWPVSGEVTVQFSVGDTQDAAIIEVLTDHDIYRVVCDYSCVTLKKRRAK